MAKNKLGDLLNQSGTFNQGSSLAQNLLSQVGNARGLSGALLVPFNMVVPNEKQVRRSYNEEALVELSEDIRQRGILEPLIVRLNAEKKYEIVGGWRRYLAAQRIGLLELPVVVHEMSDREAELVNLAENIQREGLEPADEQRFFRYLQDSYNLGVNDIARMISKSSAYVRRRLQGQLASFQQEDEKEAEVTNSEENHNNDDTSSLLEKSQSIVSNSKAKTPKPNQIKPTSFNRLARTLSETLNALDKQLPDPGTRQNLLDRLDEIEYYVVELRHKLAKEKK